MPLTSRPDLSLPDLLGQVLGGPTVDGERCARLSFAELGGTSLQALNLVALGEQQLGVTLEVSRLLGPEPVDTAFAAAEPYRPLPSNEDQHPENQPLLVGQRPMLAAHLLGQDRFYHLMFTLHSREALDPRRVRDAITTLTRRHESLRTVFSVDDGSFRRRVLNHWEPDLVVQRLALAADVIATVHGGLAAESVRILRPLRRPAAHFVLTQTPDGDLLTFLVHHLLADGWALGILLKEFAALYARPAADLAAAVSPEAVAADADRAEQTGVLEVSRERLKERLKGVPLSLALPTDVVRPAAFDGVGARLVSQLRDEARAAVDIVARREGVTGTSVLMSAWGLVVARRCGVEDLLIGVPVAHRGSHALAEAVALRTRVVPVRCRVPSKVTVGAYVRSIAGELAAAVADAALPFETLPDTLGRQPDPRQNPLTQIGFAAHDDLVPAQLDLGGGHPARVVEGHCGGAVFDALLYVQSRNDQLRVALDYAPSAQSAEEAASLVESLDGALRELAADGSARLGDLSAMSPRQGQDVLAHGAPSDVPAVDSIWSAFEIAARSSPRQVAIRPGAQAPRLTYAQLYDAACAQSQALHLAGVRAGDRVALALPRSAAETVAVLAVLRLGAAYVALDPASPSAWLAHVLESSRPRAVVADGDRAALVRPLLSPDCPLLPSRPHPDPAPPFTGDGSTGDGSIGDDMVPAYATGPDDIAYVCFTSGTTGRPKGVAVPHRGVLRLLADPTMLAPAGPPETGSRTAGARRFLRLAPLSFDASTLELFAPLLTGGCLHIFTPEPVAVSALADFIRDEKLTGAWLTAGLFRLVADHRPDAFAGLDVLLTGGDVVPVDRVTAVLSRHRGLRVINGYGPTENTTFTTVYAVDDVAQLDDSPLPVGRPVAGTGVVLLNEAAHPVPPGAVGEIVTYGEGLSVGYLGNAADDAFPEVAVLGGRRAYRTGDLGRWDRRGQLRFHGRKDRQLKVGGHRIELTAVEACLRAHPQAVDAFACAVGSDAADRRLLVAVVPDVGPGPDVESLRAFARERLPAWSVPVLWAVVPVLPLTANGKPDTAALRSLAAEPGTSTLPDDQATSDRASNDTAAAPAADELEELVSSAWCAVLGVPDIPADAPFFDVGGDSLQMIRLRDRLRQNLPMHRVSIVDLYRYPTISEFADHLAAQVPSS